MKNKIIIARKLGKTARQSGKYNKEKKTYKRCYWAYVWQCLIKANDTFVLSFNGKYIPGFFTRIKEWIEYLFNKKTFPKPIHVKVTNAPNETKLDWFLEKSGLEVKEEYLGPVVTRYTIGKI